MRAELIARLKHSCILFPKNRKKSYCHQTNARNKMLDMKKKLKRLIDNK